MITEFEKRILTSFILIPVTIFFVIKGSLYFTFFLSILFLATSYEWFKLNKGNDLIKIFGIFFLLFSFYATFEIRKENSFEYILFIVIICIFTDIGGYVFGKIFKGPKLTKISPKKTISGALGSLIFTCVVILSLIYIETNFLNFSIFIVSLITSISCQFGDLFFSFLKRKAKLKDTGNFLPGHGGELDRLDGIFFGIPFGFLTLILLFK